MERSKYGFPVVPAVVAVIALFLAAPRAAPATSRPGRDVAVKLQQNTVRIEAHFGDQIENGFGFIVGEREGVLYAVTAYHVVNPDDMNVAQPAKVRVWLFDHQGEPVDATLLGTHEGDLAVITFPAPAGFKWDTKSLGTDDQRDQGTQVWFIGRGGEWTIPMTAGTISSDDPNDSRIEIEDFAVRPGSSGGPLIASSGIVGMVLDDSAAGARALSISFIQRKMKKWNHPFQLQSGAQQAKAADDDGDTPAEAVVEKTAPPPRAAPKSPEDEMAAKGAAIAARDPLAMALREQQPDGAARRGFDLGMAIAEGQTAWGPGKQAFIDSLAAAEREGCSVAAHFSVDRNHNEDFARIGAAIAEVDPVVERARKREPDARYWLGFDIATGIFGDPKRGAAGHTAQGPGSDAIRDALSAPAQRGYRASVAMHLARRSWP